MMLASLSSLFCSQGRSSFPVLFLSHSLSYQRTKKACPSNGLCSGNVMVTVVLYVPISPFAHLLLFPTLSLLPCSPPKKTATATPPTSKPAKWVPSHSCALFFSSPPFVLLELSPRWTNLRFSGCQKTPNNSSSGDHPTCSRFI